MPFFRRKKQSLASTAQGYINKTPTILLVSMTLMAMMAAAASMTAGLPALLGSMTMVALTLLIIITLHMNHDPYFRHAQQLNAQEKGLANYGKGLYLGMYALAATAMLMGTLMGIHLLAQPPILDGFSLIFGATLISVIIASTATAGCMAFLHPKETQKILGRLAGEGTKPSLPERARSHLEHSSAGPRVEAVTSAIGAGLFGGSGQRLRGQKTKPPKTSFWSRLAGRSSVR